MSILQRETPGNTNGWLSIFLSIFLLVSSSPHRMGDAVDRLVAGGSLSLNQTLVSAAGTFALGFFCPGNSTSRCYLGIWYNRVPGRVVVWVANRGNPVPNSDGSFAFTEEGNIAVQDGERGVLWSSDAKAVPKGTAAVLQDSGNLVLRDTGCNDIWQSFDHPTDTALPTMKLTMKFRTGMGTYLTSWRDAGDPSPGEFSTGFYPNSPLQLGTWRRRNMEFIWRTSGWSGVTVTSVASNTDAAVVRVEANDEESSILFHSFGISGLAGTYSSRRAG